MDKTLITMTAMICVTLLLFLSLVESRLLRKGMQMKCDAGHEIDDCNCRPGEVDAVLTKRTARFVGLWVFVVLVFLILAEMWGA